MSARPGKARAPRFPRQYSKSRSKSGCRGSPQLATVFRTYVDTAEFIPSAIYALPLTIFDFRAVFVVCGLPALTVGVAATWLPRRLQAPALHPSE